MGVVRSVKHCDGCLAHMKEYNVHCKCGCRDCQLACWGYTDKVNGMYAVDNTKRKMWL